MLTDPKQRAHNPVGEVGQEPGLEFLVRLMLVVKQHRHHLTVIHGPADQPGEQWLWNQRLPKIEIFLNGMHHLVAQHPLEVLISTMNVGMTELNQIRARDVSTHQARLIAAVTGTVDNTHTGQRQENR